MKSVPCGGKLDNKLANRSVNEGLSPVVKKRNEVFRDGDAGTAIEHSLDETDSGLDIDALAYRSRRGEQVENLPEEATAPSINALPTPAPIRYRA